MRPRKKRHRPTSRLLVWLSLAAAGAGTAWAGSVPIAEALAAPTRVQTIEHLIQSRLAERRVRWTPEQVGRAADAVDACSRAYGYEPEFILGLIDVESGFRMGVTARDGSVGLVQIKPATARAICRVQGWVPPPASALHDPGINITLGVAYLAYLERTLGSREMALAGYNMGEIAAKRKRDERGAVPRQSYRSEVQRRSALIARALPPRSR